MGLKKKDIRCGHGSVRLAKASSHALRSPCAMPLSTRVSSRLINIPNTFSASCLGSLSASFKGLCCSKITFIVEVPNTYFKTLKINASRAVSGSLLKSLTSFQDSCHPHHPKICFKTLRSEHIKPCPGSFSKV